MKIFPVGARRVLTSKRHRNCLNCLRDNNRRYFDVYSDVEVTLSNERLYFDVISTFFGVEVTTLNQGRGFDFVLTSIIQCRYDLRFRPFSPLSYLRYFLQCSSNHVRNIHIYTSFYCKYSLTTRSLRGSDSKLRYMYSKKVWSGQAKSQQCFNIY